MPWISESKKLYPPSYLELQRVLKKHPNCDLVKDLISEVHAAHQELSRYQSRVLVLEAEAVQLRAENTFMLKLIEKSGKDE